VRIILTLAAAALVMLAFGGHWGRRMATTFLCFMLAVKMFEMFRVRDLRLVASVSFFLIATQFLFSERLIFTLYLLAGSAAAVAALVRIQHHVERSEGSAVESGSAGTPGASLVGQALILLAAAMPVALVLFALFPRLAQPLWGLPDQVMDGRTGLSDSMSPGSIATLIADESPAFRVEFEGQAPPAPEMYWRGPVLWLFDGDTWHQPVFTTGQPGAPVPDGPEAFTYTVQLEPHERRWLFVLDYPVEAPDDARHSLDHQLINRRPVTALKRYTVRSNPDFTDMPELNDSLRRFALRLPEGRNPRTLEFAREMRERHRDDRELIEALLDWFRTEEFYYTLETTPTGRHGTDEFLFDLREGFCEHYASAFAVIMREAGIPARIVTGYQGGYWPAGGDYLLVRQSDAHAWVEVWLDQTGWTRVDPTAAVSPSRIRDGATSIPREDRFLLDMEWVQAMRFQYDRLQHMWNRWVLGFDAARQQRMLERLGLPGMTPARIGLVMVAALALAVLIIAGFVLKRPRPPDDPLQKAWMRLLRRLARAGAIKRPAETPHAFLRRARTLLPSDADRLSRLESLYLRARYGPWTDATSNDFISAAQAYRPRSGQNENRNAASNVK
ncbi:MAG: transglutaminase TgpA family protein, partial [Wenzhouxiangella sp.]